MIVIKVELWSAVTNKITTLGVMKIANTAQYDNGNVCDYRGEVMTKPDFEKVTRSGIVAHHRRHDKVIWNLVAKMLRNMGYLQ
jgi:hypothetical protein